MSYSSRRVYQPARRLSIVLGWILCACTPLTAIASSGSSATNDLSRKRIDILVAGVPADSFRVRTRILSQHDEILELLVESSRWLDNEISKPKIDNDEMLGALENVTASMARAGQYGLCDDLAHLLIDLTRAAYGDRDWRVGDAYRVYSGIARVTRGSDESRRALDESRCILESANATQTMSYAKLIWADSNWQRWRDAGKCVDDLSRALALAEEVQVTPTTDQANMTCWLGWMELHTGRHDLAIKHLHEAELEFGHLGLDDCSTMGTIIAAKGDLAAIAGDWKTAETLYQRSSEIFDETGAKRGGGMSYGSNNVAFLQAKQGRYDEAWKSLQRYREGQASQASIAVAPWRTGSDASYANLLNLRHRLVDHQGVKRVLAESPHVSTEAWKALIDQVDLTAQCMRAEGDYARAHPVPKVGLNQLKVALAPDEAYVGWIDARFGDALLISTGPFRYGRLMYIVRPGRDVKWVPISEMTTREEDTPARLKARRYIQIRTRAAGWRQHVDDDPEFNELAHGNFPRVIAPALPELEGVRRLVMEFACYDEFIDTDAVIDDNGHYLVDRFAVSYAPCASVFMALQSLPKSRDRGRMTALAVGDPVFSQTPVSPDEDSRLDDAQLRGAVQRDAAVLDKLPRLAHSAEEIDRVASLFNARVLRQADASEASLDRMVASGELAKYDIVHIATHTLISGAPERCAIALSRVGLDGSPGNDGLVDATEIRLTWKLDANLVTLSGCQTAGVGFSRGEPLGIAQAMFAAGARCVLISNWKVDDLATSMLMQRFYENVATGRGMSPTSARANRVSYSEALEEAKCWLKDYRDAKGDRPYAHPVYWAGFFLVGDAN
jgi:tetratricopeptide (TPR) repeat protein